MDTELMNLKNRRVVVIGGVLQALSWLNLFNSMLMLPFLIRRNTLRSRGASLRAMVEPSFAERSVINHRDYLTNGRIITSRAINVTDKEVLTAEAVHLSTTILSLPLAICILSPELELERLSQYETDKISRFHLIIGGGPTGVELTGEIAVDFPEKEVTLVHNGSRLMQFIGPKASNKTLDWLRSKRVEVKLEQSVNLNSVSDGSRTYQTSAGETIEADCHFLCTGSPLGSAWLKETFLKDKLDIHGD
ncbi:Apoptosis-inducing factor-like A [Vitis vinifera]|uniref:Apoptosis-inducing factor-like A n=1 Tax=Vitis vinifera TaxID=29760 RepID=A0A438D8K1_VITVI|nr:Apoptosis-inducing factor-like A [Vitis vinifera]